MKIIVYVPAESAAGMPEIVRVEVTTTELAYSDGEHYGMAQALVRDADYTPGSPCFDQEDIGSNRAHWDAIASTIDPS